MNIDFKKLHENPKLRHWIVGAFLLVFVTVFMIFTDFGLFRRYKLEFEKNMIEKDIQRQRHISDSLLQVIYKMQSDTFEIERVAREKYGLVKQTEQIYFISTDTINNQDLKK
ncbi:MAG: septum formation initiator family protein [Candidatus Kapabacteria bacterium]|nr:septum formation initiator family protein [Candidatus Kapabacteria bacterium]